MGKMKELAIELENQPDELAAFLAADDEVVGLDALDRQALLRENEGKPLATENGVVKIVPLVWATTDSVEIPDEVREQGEAAVRIFVVENCLRSVDTVSLYNDKDSFAAAYPNPEGVQRGGKFRVRFSDRATAAAQARFDPIAWFVANYSELKPHLIYKLADSFGKLEKSRVIDTHVLIPVLNLSLGCTQVLMVKDFFWNKNLRGVVMNVVDKWRGGSFELSIKGAKTNKLEYGLLYRSAYEGELPPNTIDYNDPDISGFPLNAPERLAFVKAIVPKEYLPDPGSVLWI